jgi:drug/metabolite transporter (DMT)-like permease
MGYYELSADGADVSVVSPLIGLYTLVPIVLGLIFLKEKKTLTKFAGIFLSCLSVVLLGLTSLSIKGILKPMDLMFFSIAFFSWGANYFLKGLAHFQILLAFSFFFLKLVIFFKKELPQKLEILPS